jgi:hypothetical protein
LLGIGIQQRHVADTPVQIVPLNALAGWLRNAKMAVVERIAEPFRCCSQRAAEKSKQSAPLPYLRRAGASLPCREVFLVPSRDVMRPVPLFSQAKSSASRSDVQFVPNEPCDIPGLPKLNSSWTIR